MSSQSAINLQRYVALGDSITAGYADGALYEEGQQNAYPYIMAGLFKYAGAGSFSQPWMPARSPGVNPDGQSRLVLKHRLDALTLSYLSAQGDTNALSQNNYAREGPYNNMGVPGARVVTTLMPGFGNPANGEGNYNPFFTRMASNLQTASILSDALLQEPTFFSLFIGNNDALAYALSGGTANSITPVEGLAGQGFEGSFKAIVNALTGKGARGVVASLPGIEQIPYFTTIPYNGLLLSAAEAAALNKAYSSMGIHFSEGENNFLMDDTSIKPHGVRLMQKGDLILSDIILDQDKENYLKAKKPIPKKYTLVLPQVLYIQKAVAGYNRVIQAISREKKLAFVDIHALVKSARQDRFYNPHTLNVDYARKGVFSLDSLHPNFFGQALIANEFIRSVNVTYGADIPFTNSARYKGIVFP